MTSMQHKIVCIEIYHIKFRDFNCVRHRQFQIILRRIQFYIYINLKIFQIETKLN